MARNIVILLDGTSNEIKADRSNILRLYGALEKSQTQLVYYDPGVGTFGSDRAWSRWSRKAGEVWGMATGWGMDTNVKEAYRFLVDTCCTDENREPDRIYLMGFSRGAYTARVLAGFLNAFGLMEPRNLNLLDYAYRAYKRLGDTLGPAAFDELALYQRVLQPRRPTVRLLGLFDTVSSIIESGRVRPRMRKHAFTRINPSVQAVRHAVAIDERRRMFRPMLWPEGQVCVAADGSEAVQDAREVWFSGVHADVGGGYPERDAGLAKIPLAWMIDQTRPMGLEYEDTIIDEIVLGRNPEKPYVSPDPLALPQNSLTLGWRLVEYLPERAHTGITHAGFGGFSLPRGARRVIPEGAYLHASVLARIEAADATPLNLPDAYNAEP